MEKIRLQSAGSWFSRALRSAAAGFGEAGVLELAAEEIVVGEEAEVGFHPEDDEDLEELADRGAGSPAFDQVKRGPADAGAFGDLFRAQLPAEPRELQVLAERGEEALVLGQEMDGFLRHSVRYFGRKRRILWVLSIIEAAAAWAATGGLGRAVSRIPIIGNSNLATVPGLAR